MSSAVVHDFAAQLARGKRAEERLDRYFTTWFVVWPALLYEDKQGIDRWFERAKGDRKGERFPVQYKCDWRAAETGNALIELSHEPEGGGYRPGWARRRFGGKLIYFCPTDESAQAGTVYVLPGVTVGDHCAQWEAGNYRRVQIQNQRDEQHWTTTGLLLPLGELEKASEKVLGVK